MLGKCLGPIYQQMKQDFVESTHAESKWYMEI